MDLLESGQFTRTVQPAEAEGGYTKPLAKSDLVVDWKWPADKLVNWVRALADEPGAQTGYSGGVLKLGKLSRLDVPSQAVAGTVIGPIRGKGFGVACADGAVLVETVKPAGKGWMPAWSFWQGNAVKPGDVLGVTEAVAG